MTPEPKPVLVPHEVPCQYHVTPAGGLPERVSVLSPQVFADDVGFPGAAGFGFTITATLPQVVDQQSEVLFLALM